MRRNDAVTVDELADLDVAGVLLSPGPGTPAGRGRDRADGARRGRRRGVPVLGVCLGHQAIAEAFGGEVVRAPELLHGKTSQVVHDGAGVLAGLPVAVHRHPVPLARRRRRHACPPSWRSPARTPSGIVMALRHRELPIEGVQFHPESVLTEGGHRMLATWLTTCGLAPDPAALEAASAAAERLNVATA